MKHDAVDREILNLLQQNAKMKMKDIAEKLGMTITPIYERIKRMERDGVIENYTVNIDKRKLGYHLIVFCSVTLKEHSMKNLEQFEKDVIALDQVLECSHMSGNFDYLLKLVVKNMEDYQLFISKQLAAKENIGQVQSYFVMKQIKGITFVVS